MTELLESVNQTLWGTGLVLLLLGTGAFCIVTDRMAAVRSLRHLGKTGRSGIHVQSPFQACMTALAAAMGTGNIAGVATALTLGGAGAIFWMWAAALFGTGLIYAENVLSCRFRREGCAGAAAYLRHGLGSPVLAGIFCICTIAAGFGMGCMTQTHAMAQSLEAAWHIPPVISGTAAAVVTGIVIFGGAGRTGRFAAAVMPVLTGVYLIAAGVVIVRFRFHIGETIVEIFRSAFGWQQAASGIAGAAIRQTVSVGVRRGVFSNEAGLGSSGMLHSEADCTDPRVLGAIGVLEVIADTFVCCTATALAVLTSGAMDSGADGAALVLAAFHKGLGNAADWILPPVIALFALCTLIGWSHCGASALRSLGGMRFLTAYRIFFCIFAVIGAVSEPGVVWTIADMANACMAYCNLPGILLLYPKYHK